MVSEQQKQTLEYFQAGAGAWADAARGRTADVNIIRQRNDIVLRVADARGDVRSALDVGCGTGDLCCGLSARGIHAVGVDFAPEMIRLSQERAAESGADKAEFVCASIFDYDFAAGPFDLVSGNGFIEYISLEELRRALDLLRAHMTPGGSLVLGSRNRLFNLVSFNDFTDVELRDGTYATLAREAMAIGAGTGVLALADLEVAPWPEQGKVYTRTGVDVASRYQYTPAQLGRLLTEHGYAPQRIVAAHVHAAMPAFRAAHPEAHASAAEYLQQYAWDDARLIPNASTFMIEARTR